VRTLPYEVLLQGSLSGEHRAGATLIEDRSEWQVFWRRHCSWRIPVEAEPEVDFAKHCVLVVSAGDEPSAGWSIETSSVAHDGERLLVRAVLYAPAEDALEAQLSTQPYQILLVERTRGPAVLELDQRRSTR
jgi:hypothetical protein